MSNGKSSSGKDARANHARLVACRGRPERSFYESATICTQPASLPETLELYHARFQGDRFKSESTIRAAGFFVLGALLSVIGAAQAGAIDPAARKDIDAGNQAWVAGMKDGRSAPIAATYAENAVDCTAAGECVKGRAAIEDYLRLRLAKFGRATSATATSLGSVQTR